MDLKYISRDQCKCYETPEIVRYLGGGFASQIIEIWGIEGVGDYMLAPSVQRHVWHAVLSVDSVRLPPRTELRSWLTKGKRRSLLNAAFGSVPPGMIQLLSKLQITAETAEFYEAVHAVLSRRDALSTFLHHQREIDPNVVLCIAHLPIDAEMSKLAGHALKQGVSPFEIGELSWLGKRILAVSGRDKAEDTFQIHRNPYSALRNEIARLPFPAPPWDAFGIVPIRSPHELFDIARSMGNCLSDRAHFYSSTIDVQAGIAYYFRTTSEDFLLLKFSKFGQMGWYLDECRGAKNRRPTLEEVTQIELFMAEFEEAWIDRLSYKIL